jgi:hypothetical protein
MIGDKEEDPKFTPTAGFQGLGEVRHLKVGSALLPL